MAHHLVVVLALLAAACSALGIVIRQRATMEVPQEHSVSTTMLTTLLGKRLWWAGTAVAVGGYAMQALALAKGSLLLVQPLLVSSLLFALPLSAHLAHKRVTRIEWAWAVLLTVGLAVFVLEAHTRPGYRAPVQAWTLAMAVLVPLVVVCVAIAARTVARARAVLLAVAVAVLFGVVAVLTKITMHLLAEGGITAVVRVPAPYLLVVLALTATVLQQSAFHAGQLQMSVPTMLVLEPLVAVAIGVLVLGEKFELTGIAMALLPVAVVAMLTSAIALGRTEGAYENELEAAAARQRALPASPRL
jgi:drug/metabolite transporter (DMT)-like permease